MKKKQFNWITYEILFENLCTVYFLSQKQVHKFYQLTEIEVSIYKQSDTTVIIAWNSNKIVIASI